MNDLIHIDRAGIRSQFPKVKSYLKAYFLGPAKWDEKELMRLKRYAKGDKFSFTYSPEFDHSAYTFSTACTDLGCISMAKYWHAIHGALKQEYGWRTYWQQAVAYAFWSDVMDIKWHFHSLDEFNRGKRPQRLKTIFLDTLGWHIADCLILGWTDLAIHLSKLAYQAMDNDLFNDAGDAFGRRRTQHFILRLISDWQGWNICPIAKCAHDEPLFNLLINHWREPNVDKLVPLLLAVCDRHTHQAHFDTSREFFDLGHYEQFYDPYEILSVFRLRELIGLSNPVLDHPLMKTPLAQLPPVSEPYVDELLTGILSHARQEFPGL